MYYTITVFFFSYSYILINTILFLYTVLLLYLLLYILYLILYVLYKTVLKSKNHATS